MITIKETEHIIKIGDEFYFPYFHNYGNVTDYYSDNMFWFKLCGDSATQHRSQVLPSELVWIKKKGEK